MPEVKKSLRFKINGIRGVLVSHEHKDHSKYIKEFLKCGIRVLALPSVFESQGISSPFAKRIEPMHGYMVGGFKVLPLPVAHDVPCVGFVIEHEEMGKLVFITDTMMLEYKLPKLNHIMLEANYSDEILQGNIDDGIVPVAMRSRLLHSHMELETAKGILRSNDLSTVNEVVLLHLSGDNSDAGLFRREVQEMCGKPVYIAANGLEINLDKEAY